MIRKTALTLALISALTAPMGAQAQEAASPAELLGVWRNGKDSVHVEIKPCGASACGFVIWASDEARADVKKGSGKELIGLQLLRDLAPTKDGQWRGKVFVADLNVTVTGLAKVTSATKLKAKGCLLGSMFCKAQTWTRIAG